jgi:hypothetical protein
MSDYLEDRSPNSKKPFDVWLDRLKSIAQIAAIVGAAGWAIWRFGVFDSAEYEQRARMEGRVEWVARSDEECMAWYNVKFENTGKRSIELTQFDLSVWPLEVGDVKGRIAYVDIDKVVEGARPLINQSILNRISSHFSPGTGDDVGIFMIVKRAPRQMLLFKATGSSRIVGETKTRDWNDHREEYVCDEGPPSKGVPKDKERAN